MRLFVYFIFSLGLYPILAGAAISRESMFFPEDTVIFTYDTVYLEAIGKNFEKGPDVTEYQEEANLGGNTSIRNVDSLGLKWKTQGYFQRNRDLGQLFIPKKDTELKSIVVRTGPAESAVLANTPGKAVFLQFFEIEGDPVINDNGTPRGTPSTHGFSTNHRTDDFIEGIEYHSLPVIFRGIFPEDIPVTKNEAGEPVGTEGTLYYFRWTLGKPYLFEANKRYGFMMGFLEPGPGLGFTLANANKAAISDVPSLDDVHTPYKGGWAFRREGDGTLPPTMIPGDLPPDNDSLVSLLRAESLFAEGVSRFLLSPTSDGYPDVDTYRAYEFYIEEENYYVELEGIDLQPDTLELFRGEDYRFIPIFIPEDASNKEVTWFSSNSMVAGVDDTGLLTAYEEGTASVSVISTLNYMNSTSIVKVKANPLSVEELQGRETEIILYPNPSQGTLTIRSEGRGLTEIRIYSMDGRRVFQQEIHNTPEYMLNPGLENGLYLIHISTEDKEFTRLVEIQ